MAHPLHDTIVAPITGLQSAAVAIVRLSGPQSWDIAQKVFSPWPEPVTPRLARYGRFAHGDDGLALPFAEGHSYTGEQSVELNLHGSMASVRQLIDACVAAGARLAEPGEFTYRAFMNGRIDLTAAEGVRETIEAQTAFQLRQAHLLREGALNAAVSQVRDDVFGVLASVEATVDFSEEIGDLDRLGAVEELDSILHRVDDLLATEESGRLVREGFTVAIVGRPNAGKSSLLNAILRAERAIVTPIPGTTRDTIEEWAEIHGVKVRLIDTAGLREGEDAVETIGIQRARDAAQNADAIWYVYDAQAGWSKADKDECARLPTNTDILANKSDLLVDPPTRGRTISAVTGAGITALLEDLTRGFTEHEVGIAINARQAPLIQAARAALKSARQTLVDDIPVDLSAVHLRDAVMHLGQVTGETATEDMVSRIFRDFCIGK